MSTFFPSEIPCGGCGQTNNFMVAHSINVPRRPEDRVALLDGTLQSFACEQCGALQRVAPEFVWFDPPRGEWILVRPNHTITSWQGLEEIAHAVFDNTFGAGASPQAQQMGARLKKRAVFGWPALTEKVYAWSQGLDDLALELAKLAIIRANPPEAWSDDLELRLTEVDAELLTFVYVHGDTEEVEETMVLDRAAYDGIATQAGWEALRAALGAGPYVDLQRLMTPGDEASDGDE